MSKLKVARRKSKVVARLTITRTDSSKKTIIEVHADASFGSFYQFYSQEGRKRKRFMRSANRNEGIHPYYLGAFVMPGLDVVAKRIAGFQKCIKSMQIKVFSKRKYNQLLSCAPDKLSGSLPRNDIKIPHWSQVVGDRRRIPVQLPAERFPLRKHIALTEVRS